jgi:hypothetical protein
VGSCAARKATLPDSCWFPALQVCSYPSRFWSCRDSESISFGLAPPQVDACFAGFSFCLSNNVIIEEKGTVQFEVRNVKWKSRPGPACRAAQGSVLLLSNGDSVASLEFFIYFRFCNITRSKLYYHRDSSRSVSLILFIFYFMIYFLVLHVVCYNKYLHPQTKTSCYSLLFYL